MNIWNPFDIITNTTGDRGLSAVLIKKPFGIGGFEYSVILFDQ